MRTARARTASERLQRRVDGHGEEKMGIEGQNGFYSSCQRIVHAERQHNRSQPCVEESVSERPRLRHADAYLLHQPGWTRAQRRAAGRTGEGKDAVGQKDGSAEEIPSSEVIPGNEDIRHSFLVGGNS